MTNARDTRRLSVTSSFQRAFESICQFEAFAERPLWDDQSSLVKILAGRKTAHDFNTEERSILFLLCSRIPAITGIWTQYPLESFRQGLSLDIIHKLEQLTSNSLGVLDRLTEEAQTVGRCFTQLTHTISEDRCKALQEVLYHLHVFLHQTLGDMIEPETEARFLKHLKTSTMRTRSTPQEQRSRDYTAGAGATEIFENYLIPSVTQMYNDSKSRGASMQRTGLACVNLFLGLLLLYVPDRPLDPALTAMVENTAWQQYRSELESKLSALQRFEALSTGQATSVRCELVKQEIQGLGHEPKRRVVRSGESKYAELQSLFSSVLKSVVYRCISDDRTGWNTSLRGEDIDLVQENIRQIILQLTHGFESYCDIVSPLIGFLGGLRTGLCLLSISSSTKASPNTTTEDKSLPLLGVNMETLQLRRIIHGEEVTNAIQFLKRMSLEKDVTGSIPKRSESLFSAIQSIYDTWKTCLESDRNEHSAKSNLYHYKGSQVEDEASEQAELADLFPEESSTFQSGSEQPVTLSHEYPRTLSQSTANLLIDIFHRTAKPTESVLSYVSELSKQVSTVIFSENGSSPISNNELASVAIIKLYETIQDLMAGKYRKAYDFYKHVNIEMVKDLLGLLRLLRRQFSALQERWPEHSVLADVLTATGTLLSISFVEPVAKWLPKVEKLHALMYEWQSVASREYSVEALYNEVTELIIRARRLELSTWARLLELEHQKCQEDSKSWFLVVYEALLPALADIGEPTSVERECIKPLVSELSKFMSSSPVGQFSARLDLLRLLRCLCQLLEESRGLSSVLSGSLESLGRYYDRHTSSIQDFLRKGRKDLEKQVKDLVLLASWKDKNVNALRESSKRLRFRLFKLVKKYRALLAGPVDSILASQPPVDTNSRFKTLELVQSRNWAMPTSSTFDICVASLGGWTYQPRRLRDPSMTVANIRKLCRWPQDRLRCSSDLESLSMDLTRRISEFAKETPESLTTGNKDAVKQLKSMKRLLFASVLKQLRIMGIRYNLDVLTLKEQDDASKVLISARTAEPLRAYDENFYGFLDKLTSIRKGTGDHAGELTSNEVVRGLGFLEGLLHALTSQRKVLTESFGRLDSFDKTLTTLTNLSAGGGNVIAELGTSRGKPAGCEKVLSWLSAILQTSCIVLEKHQSLGGVDSSALREELELWRSKIDAWKQELLGIPLLPASISTRECQAIDQLIQEETSKIARRLTHFQSKFPAVTFVMKPLEPWIDALHHRRYDILGWASTYRFGAVECLTPNHEMMEDLGLEESSPVDTMDTAMLHSVDAALLIIQQSHATMEKLPTSTDEAGWLVRTDHAFAKVLRNFSNADVGKRLEASLLSEKLDEQSLRAIQARITVILPILEQYRESWKDSINQYCELHRSACRLAFLLSNTFKHLLEHGFCTPPERSEDRAQNGELEDGVGLGGGEGAEDISKDIQDDEDLSDLAEHKDSDGERDRIENEADAVEMADADLEGEAQDGDGSKSGSEAGEQEGIEDAEDEIGSIGSHDQSQVDEKMWEAEQNDSFEAESKGQRRGENPLESSRDEQRGTGEDEGPQTAEIDAEDEDGVDEDRAESAEQKQLEPEDTGTRTQEDGNLDLPEDMEVDKRKEAESALTDDEMDELSSVSKDESDPEDANQSMPDENDEEDDIIPDPQGRSIESKEDDEMDEGSGDNEQEAKDEELKERRDQAADVSQEDVFRGDAVGPKGADQQDVAEDDTQIDSGGQAGTGIRSQDAMDAEAGGIEGDVVPGRDPQTAEDGSRPRQGENSNPFQRLGDALQQWTRRRKQILDAQDAQKDTQPSTNDNQALSQEYGHLQDEQEDGDEQMLGQASEEQAQKLGQEAISAEVREDQDDRTQFPAEAVESNKEIAKDFEQMNGQQPDGHSQSNGALIGQPNAGAPDIYPDAMELDEGIDIERSHIPTFDVSAMQLVEEARRLWTLYERRTQSLSFSLAEQLRLILAPTLKSKMRGDFRSGKRLNIKRIIPYIASGYKRDKIWMRRSIASKRSYQVMLAVDDSKSMSENGSGRLALETLAMVSKSLSLLEVGQICVVGFGSDTVVAHPFDKPFSSNAGVDVFQRFTFQQAHTDVHKLVATSLELLREARAKQLSSEADLWQLQLIISDGVCENHRAIQRLVRQAQEEKVMIIFVVIDSMGSDTSIIDMTQASFEASEGDGEPNLKVTRYLETFPFGCYLIVRDVKALPSVLANALRQWFVEVADRSS